MPGRGLLRPAGMGVEEPPPSWKLLARSIDSGLPIPPEAEEGK